MLLLLLLRWKYRMQDENGASDTAGLQRRNMVGLKSTKMVATFCRARMVEAKENFHYESFAVNFSFEITLI